MNGVCGLKEVLRRSLPGVLCMLPLLVGAHDLEVFRQVDPELADVSRAFMADLDGDGDGDFVAVSGNRVLLYRNDGSPTAGIVPVELEGFTDKQVLAVCDLDGDGFAELIGDSRTFAGVRAVFRNRGGWPPAFEEEVIPAVQAPSDSINPLIRIGDFDDDGALDVVSHWRGGRYLSINRSGTRGQWESRELSTVRADGVVVADIDGDGRADIATYSNTLGQNWHLSLSSGASVGEFIEYTPILELIPTSIATGDINGDGRDEILAATSTGGLYSLRLVGVGELHAEPVDTPFLSINRIEAVHADDDEWVDFVLTTPAGGQIVLLRNRGGANPSFEAINLFSPGFQFMPNFLGVSHVDNRVRQAVLVAGATLSPSPEPGGFGYFSARSGIEATLPMINDGNGDAGLQPGEDGFISFSIENVSSEPEFGVQVSIADKTGLLEPIDNELGAFDFGPYERRDFFVPFANRATVDHCGQRAFVQVNTVSQESAQRRSGYTQRFGEFSLFKLFLESAEPRPILDGGGSVLTLSGTINSSTYAQSYVNKVELTVILDHARTEDIEVGVFAPQELELARLRIPAGLDEVTYKVEAFNELEDFRRFIALGTWRLRVRDTEPGVAGSLLFWHIDIWVNSVGCAQYTSTSPTVTPTPVPTQTATPTPSPSPSPTPTSSAPSSDPNLVLANLGPQHWESSGAVGALAPIEFFQGEGLGFRAGDADQVSFGFWQTRLALDSLHAGTHRITAKVIAKEPGRPRFAELRLRAFTEANRTTSMDVRGEFLLGMSENLTVIHESDGATPWRLAIDLLNAEPDRGGAFVVTEINIESMGEVRDE